MYKAHFGLKSKPFRLNPHLRFLFNSEAIQRAVNSLKYGLYQREGLVLLTGGTGCGKTLLIQNISRRLPDAGIQVHTITIPRIDAHGLMQQILNVFGVEAAAGTATAEMMQVLQKHLLARVDAGERFLLVIDEAHNLDDEALDLIRLLSDMQSPNSGSLLLQIFLVAQPGLRARLASPRHESLRQRFLVTDHIDGLSADEVPQYILRRMQLAGWQNGEIPFDAEAITRIQQATSGNPRKINTLCERLLTQAYVEEQSRIRAADVDSTLQDMDEEWRSTSTAPQTDSPSSDARLQTLERRMTAFDATLNQISQVTNSVLVRLDTIPQD
ncbi:MAG: AAA family ATPase [Lautropia sp.]|nr:AAA family ATPase [Lautropia sp.]